MKEQYLWINRVKLLACILVVLGHFLSGLILSNIIENNIFLEWFSKTIYYFHVPLFFICSGYLYQNSRKINSFKEWWGNIKCKFISLGIPYFVFSTITIIMKIIAANSVNNQAPPYLKTLLFNPIAPYWYLYILFFMFCFTKTIENKREMKIITIIAMTLKIGSIIIKDSNVMNYIPYFIKGLAINWIWFVLGMNFRYLYEPSNLEYKILKLREYVYALIIGVIISILIVYFDLKNEWISFIDGFIFCFSIIGITISLSKYKSNKLERYIFKYTMEIYLMHTIFAAIARIVMIKMNIFNKSIHLIIGFIASIIVPIIVSNIMRKNRILSFLIYPKKTLKTRE